jgi:hypothetical protein
VHVEGHDSDESIYEKWKIVHRETECERFTGPLTLLHNAETTGTLISTLESKYSSPFAYVAGTGQQRFIDFKASFSNA